MFTIENINLFIKVLSIIISTFYCFVRISNLKDFTLSRIIITIAFCFVLTAAFIIINAYMHIILVLSILMLISCLYFSFVFKSKFDFSITIMLISFGLSMGIYAVSVAVGGSIYNLLIDNNQDSYIVYLLMLLIQLLFAYLIFTIKRFKNGFPFLMKRRTGIYGVFFVGIVLIFSTYVINSTDTVSTLSLISGIILCGVVLIIVIRRGIKMFYKKKMKERAIEILEEEIREKEQLIEKINLENAVLSKANHKINKRFAAMEQIVTGLAAKADTAGNEIDAELPAVLEEIKQMTTEYQNDLKNLPVAKTLPSTNVSFINSMFDMFLAECAKKNIEFNLKVNCSINYLIENIIDKSKLETMIGDHIGDAIIAVESSANIYRSILVIFGLDDDCYEMTIYDSGIEFEVDTLLKLGLERITTHADHGGSGIGFMTTFETMRECGASLIIEEKTPSAADFTKSVTVRFDGKGQYIIKTYRTDKFPTQNNRDIKILNL